MIQPGLERITKLIAHIPTPWKAIHVAGTNGKGSICAYISAMLDVYNQSQYRLATGQPALRHARFTSPHLVRPRDSISINGKGISRELFSDLRHEFRHLKKKIEPSEFEMQTAIAFEAFTQKKVDLAVIEVGMGGREDATNVLGLFGDDVPHVYRNPRFKGEIRYNTSVDVRPPPVVTAISKIGLDHQDFLGSTLTEIAAHKAGIIKTDAAVVYDMSNPAEVQDVIHKTTTDTQGAAIESWQESAKAELTGAWLDDDNVPRPAGLEAAWATAPQHVRRNASVAFRSTWAALRKLDRLLPFGNTSAVSIQTQLADLYTRMINAALHVVIPGRQETVWYDPQWFTPPPPLVIIPRKKGERRKRPVNAVDPTEATHSLLLDGAHNAQSAIALAQTVDRLRAERAAKGASTKVTWIMAASSTKDVTGILDPLLQDGDDLHAVEFATPVEDMPWVKALPAKDIVTAAQKLSDGRAIDARVWLGGVREALIVLGEKPFAGDLVVVTGSLYLVGEVKRLLNEAEKGDRILVAKSPSKKGKKGTELPLIRKFVGTDYPESRRSHDLFPSDKGSPR